MAFEGTKQMLTNMIRQKQIQDSPEYKMQQLRLAEFEQNQEKHDRLFSYFFL